jgi:uncharacterized membrane protein YbhN (UPF0104 family)
VSSLRAFADATQAFIDHLTDVRAGPLMVALLCALANLTLRSRAWLNILRAAYPRNRIAWPSVLGAYAAGVGVNAIAPARGGDVLKIVAMRQRIEGATAPTLVATLLAETVFDFVVASGLVGWAYASGRLPHLPQLGSLPAFEWSWVARARDHALVVLIGAILVGIIGTRYVRHHVRRFRARVGQGLTILRTPRRYLLLVVSYQAAGWGFRLASAYYLLRAFNVHATWQNAALALAVGSLATMLPFTPGGAGAQQALLAVALAGAASQSSILAYSVGAQVATTTLNAAVGVVAILALFGTLRLAHLRHHARHAAEPGAP